MNAWFERYLTALSAEGIEIDGEEVALVLDLAGAAARGAGARQYAPVATWLAGRIAPGMPRDERLELLRRAAAAASGAGTAATAADAEEDAEVTPPRG